MSQHSLLRNLCRISTVSLKIEALVFPISTMAKRKFAKCKSYRALHRMDASIAPSLHNRNHLIIIFRDKLIEICRILCN